MIHRVDSMISHDRGQLCSLEFAAGYQMKHLWRRTVLGREVQGFPVVDVRERKKRSWSFFSEGLSEVLSIYHGNR